MKDVNGQWIHSTIWKVPASTRINLTILQYDSGSPLRNQQWGLVAGTAALVCADSFCAVCVPVVAVVEEVVELALEEDVVR